MQADFQQQQWERRHSPHSVSSKSTNQERPRAFNGFAAVQKELKTAAQIEEEIDEVIEMDPNEGDPHPIDDDEGS